MKSLDQISTDVSEAFAARSRRMAGAGYFVKIFLIGFGSALATIASFLALQPDETPTHWNYIGMGSAILVLVGVLYMIFSEDDPTKELLLARNAVEGARALESLREEFEEIVDASDRATELYTAYDRMRDVLKQTATSGFLSVGDVLNILMTSAGRHLSLASGFPRSDQWTLCIYKAFESPGGCVLRCIAHERAIRCEVNATRPWAVGVGVGGVAYATGREILVPDMQSEGVGTLYSVGDQAREYDADRYRSVVAVPVKVGDESPPWGVVVGTSSVAYHFNYAPPVGTATAEPVRTLAAMVALVVALSPGVEERQREDDRN